MEARTRPNRHDRFRIAPFGSGTIFIPAIHRRRSAHHERRPAFSPRTPFIPGRGKGRPRGHPFRFCDLTLYYWSSLVTSCCMLLACARAEMPVWLRISYFDMLEAADA